jgi:hypothetical protein
LATPNVTAMRSEFEGVTFHRLRVNAVVPFGKKAFRLQCVCVCGKEVLAKAHELRSGERKSCGCWKREVLGEATRTHGRANSRVTGYADRTYGIWQAMRDRCNNSKRSDYHRYGGRGITCCERWERFENFLADMGEAPKGLTLDRINNDGAYAPENCRWASRKGQSHNSGACKWVTHEGATHNLSQWFTKLQLSPATYYARIRRGLSPTEALGLVKTEGVT